jgi:hypothetical protein
MKQSEWLVPFIIIAVEAAEIRRAGGLLHLGFEPPLPIQPRRVVHARACMSRIGAEDMGFSTMRFLHLRIRRGDR